MANAIEKLNTIEIGDIEKVNTLSDDDIEDLNTLEYTAVTDAAPFHGDRFILAGGVDYSPHGRIINIQYKAATSTGDASDFGDMSEASEGGAGMSNGTRFIRAVGET